jgi:hypothetical protein
MKRTIGLVEKIWIISGDKKMSAMAKFDTGAKENSIDKKFAESMGMQKVKRVRIKSTLGKESREIVEVSFEIDGTVFKAKASVSDRSKMAYPVLIGRGIIHGNFIIDTEKSNKSTEETDLK